MMEGAPIQPAGNDACLLRHCKCGVQYLVFLILLLAFATIAGSDPLSCIQLLGNRFFPDICLRMAKGGQALFPDERVKMGYALLKPNLEANGGLTLCILLCQTQMCRR